MKILYRYITILLLVSSGLNAQEPAAVYQPINTPLADAYNLPVPAAVLPFSNDTDELRAAELLADMLIAFPNATARYMLYPPEVFDEQRQMLGINSPAWQDNGLRQKAGEILGIQLAFVVNPGADGSLLLRVYDMPSGAKQNEQRFVSSRHSGSVYDAALYLAADSLAEYTRSVEPVDEVEGMKFIMGGYTMLGSADGQEDEQPETAVAVSDFYMDMYEVTVTRFGEYCEATGSPMPEQPAWSTPGHPVVNVTWADAEAYAAWAGKRLPTEAEWEFAASGGRKSQGHRFAGSGDRDAAGWYWENAGRHAHPIGEKAANELGLYDLSGNVFEWCADWYAAYDSPGNREESGRFKVIRGGSWYTAAGEMRVTSRYRYDPAETWNDNIGFRCVQDAVR